MNRLRWIATVGAVAWLALACRLIQVQALQHESFFARAKEQQKRWIDVAAKRGPVLDRRGRPLAVDVQAVSFFCDPAALREREQVARHFAAVGGRQVSQLADRLGSSRQFVYLARQVRHPQLEQLRATQFEGVRQHPEASRYYPFGELAGQILGFTDVDNNGREGVELALEDDLTGETGKAQIHVDARGRSVPELREEHRAAEHGSSVRLTIDASYQGILEEELIRAVRTSDADRALGIVSDPRTGAILAMASVPLFDPNEPGSALADDRRNRSITDSFEPGSTFKAITAAAVLEEGLAQTTTEVFCENGALTLANGDTIRDVSPHGILTLRQVLEQSSNIGAIKLASKIERGNFYDYLRRFGFGTRTGIGLPAESSGLLRHVGEWSHRSLETIAIGQELSVTAIQLALAFGAIANGGVLMAPMILDEVIAENGSVVRKSEPKPVRRVISKETAALVRSTLEGVVSRGTGKRARVDGIAVAGKTGTAQRARLDGGGYDADATVASFVGFLPADDPALLGLIVIDNPKKDRWGGHVAAPAFKRVMERIAFLADSELSPPPRLLAAVGAR